MSANSADQLNTKAFASAGAFWTHYFAKQLGYPTWDRLIGS